MTAETSHTPVPIPRVARAALLLAVLALPGCVGRAPVAFRLNTEGRQPGEISRTQAEAIAGALETLFGTPDRPETPEDAQLDLDQLRRAAGPFYSDARGNRFGLFRQHCAGCHGITGDGAGPSAGLLDPYPRDFRRGTFKYTSTMSGAKPTRADLHRTLLSGVPGTAMPSFAELPQGECEALVEYVQYLAMRGEVELFLIGLVVDEDEYLPLDMMIVEEDGVLPVTEMWTGAKDMTVTPAPEPPANTHELLAASVEEGRNLYLSKTTQCVKCHGPEGRGDGEETELYDDWNKAKKGITPEQTAAMAGRFRLPIQRLRARNFHEGVFRGGSRPKDQYWRIHVGIKGTPMPAAGPAPGMGGSLTPEEIWHVVHYVRWLSCEASGE